MDSLYDALAHLARHCSTVAHWVRTPRGPVCRPEPLRKQHLVDHLEPRGPQIGLAPIAPGESTTRVALIDCDDHRRTLDWDSMTAAVQPLLVALRERGLQPIPFRSSGGRGIHLFLLWETPQDARSVRHLLRAAAAQAGFGVGTGGVVAREVEIFPKQDRVPPDGYGNMFWLPLARESVPLNHHLQPVLHDEAAHISFWPVSAPVAESRAEPAADSPPPPVAREAAAPALSEVRALLARIPNTDLDYDRWRDVIFAIHHATGGSPEGLALAMEWSAQSRKHDPDFLATRVWPYIRSERDGALITFGSLLHWATDTPADPSVFPDMGPLPAVDWWPEEPDDHRPAQGRFLFARDGRATLRNEHPPRDEVIRDLLPAGKVWVLAGAGGSYKTASLLHRAACVALGRPYAGCAVPEPGASLLLLGEENEDEIDRRLSALADTMQLSAAERQTLRERVRVYSAVGEDMYFARWDYGRLVPTELPDQIIERAQRLQAETGVPVRLIALDHWLLIAGGDANSNNDAAVTMALAGRVAKITNAAVIIAAHVPKHAAQKDRPDQFDVLGAGAVVNLARGASVARRMTAKEAQVYGIPEEDRDHYVSETVVKANTTSTGRVYWHRRVYVPAHGAIALEYVELSPQPMADTDPDMLAVLGQLHDLGPGWHATAKWRDQCIEQGICSRSRFYRLVRMLRETEMVEQDMARRTYRIRSLEPARDAGDAAKAALEGLRRMGPGWHSAADWARECNCSSATMYRRIRALLTAGAVRSINGLYQAVDAPPPQTPRSTDISDLI